jgi:hypothetical protein
MLIEVLRRCPKFDYWSKNPRCKTRTTIITGSVDWAVSKYAPARVIQGFAVPTATTTAAAHRKTAATGLKTA